MTVKELIIELLNYPMETKIQVPHGINWSDSENYVEARSIFPKFPTILPDNKGIVCID